ncbi:MAG: hypothetical protein JNG85_11145, partial [Spirochaetaceae bacterium]|nr:hypothetical protein [Spirochaetaceae bacterium]
MLAPARPSRAARASLAGARYAHRGLYDNSGDAPENSMRAFDAAAEKGYGIELDVRLSKDGQVVVFHDSGLSRMCGVDAAVASRTFAELAEMRLLGTAERIPRFGDFLAMVAGRAPLLV